MVQCTAMSKQTHERCRRHATPGSDKCRNHGGKSPRGIASKKYKTGKYSQVLTARALSTYEQAVNDPDLLSLRHDIALLESRLIELLSRMNHADSDALWKRAAELRDRLRLAQEQRDIDAVGAISSQLSEFVDQGIADYSGWNEALGLLESRRRLVDSERKRLVDMQQMISTEQAMQLVTSLLAAVKRHVTDVRVLANVQTEFIRLTQVPDDRGTELVIHAEQ